MLFKHFGRTSSLLRRAVAEVRATATRKERSHAYDSPDDEAAHKMSIKQYGKAGYDFEYLFNLEKSKLVYKVIRLQRQVDSYITMKSLKNVDGRDKVRVEHPDPDDIIDHYQSNVRRVAFKVMYVGWDYMAYAWSEKADRNHTNVVERVFLEALLRQQLVRRIGSRLRLDRSGRTDGGVSGLSQVICANVRTELDEGYGVWSMKRKEPVESIDCEIGSTASVSDHQKFTDQKDPRFNVQDTSEDNLEIPYLSLLNRALPPDIRVVAWSPVSRYFSARRLCKSRTYRYFFPRGDLDIDLMNRAAKKLIGERDFRNFAKQSTDSMYSSTVRCLKKFEIQVLENHSDPKLPEFDICAATVTGSGFMYRQVRLMLAILYSIGKGYEDSSIIDHLLDVDETEGRPSYSSLSAIPLLLYDTEYDTSEICWRWDKESLLSVAEVMGKMWCETAMKAEVLRTMYSSAIDRLPFEEREGAKEFAIDYLQSFDGSTDNSKDIAGMDRAKSRKEFQETEKKRSIRRLLRKGKYQLAAELHSDKNAKVGWKS